jgi:ABC-type transport system substrate-binding protein
MDCTSSTIEQQARPRHQPLTSVDVTVVGAGPAGAFLAYSLAARGLHVVLDYWRKIPTVKTVVSRGVRELPVRVAALKSGEVDFAYFITGELLQSVIDDPKLRYHPNNSAPFWLMFPDMDDPKSPFHDVRVRKAVSLALDRQYLADQETAGLGVPWGNFIPPEWPGAVQRPGGSLISRRPGA